jgi:hypothetical protein
MKGDAPPHIKILVGVLAFMSRILAEIANTYKLTRSCVRVLGKDKELLLFPVLCVISVVVSFSFIISLDIVKNMIVAGGVVSHVSLFVLFLIYNFVVVFFNCALISAALERARGDNPNVITGLAGALMNIHHIVSWSAVVTVVTYLIQMPRAKGTGGTTGLFIGRSLEYGWLMITFFVMPIMIEENKGPIDAIKRSIELFQKVWGQQVVAIFGFAIINQVFLPLCYGLSQLVETEFGETAGLFFFIATGGTIFCLSYTLQSIYKVALYRFALGKPTFEFEKRDFEKAFVPKGEALERL